MFTRRASDETWLPIILPFDPLEVSATNRSRQQHGTDGRVVREVSHVAGHCSRVSQ
jgi:hypothetical protein